MTTTIRVRSPRDLISYVPYHFGFVPQDSLVLVCIRGKGSEVGLLVRADLDDVLGPGGGQLARTLVSHACADGADRVVLVGYAEEEHRIRSAVAVLATAAEGLVEPAGSWVVGPTGYRELDCPDPDCCPDGGRPLAELQSTTVSADMVAGGVALAATRADSYRLPVVPAGRRRLAQQSARRWAARADAARGDHESGLAAWRTAGLELWLEELAAAYGHEPDGGDRGPRPGAARDVGAATAGRLAAALESVPVRDAVLISLVPGEVELARGTAHGAASGALDAGTARAIGAIVDPRQAVAPDESLTRAATEVLGSVAAHVAGTLRAAPLTLLALVAWWRGDAGRAGERLRDALAVDPAYRLALLVEGALAAGLPPGWVRAAR
ncbi:DUF4192 domain-containing protein [Cellulomonas sp. PhB143]|uniref:DUF4192 domain-containing protein n=1 Tax=Cellulomonas sp. PhB143 TaxID=2485186 RepID=UPI000F48C16F|nr:DUF4192 domain-containing protein [Cellulomonas sp. PhB143]ROS73003.1 uncharacterized protein DUF4192 [Cellulomonas sp. PhB143]